MKLLRKKSLWPYIMLTLLVVFSFLVITRQIKTVQAESIEGEHLITFYDRKSVTTILSNGATIGDAIKQAKIELDTKDIVEPSLDEKLVSSNYSVNIYRARPVTIVDREIRIKVMTAHQTPRQIAESAGIKLYPEDLADMSLSTDLMSNGAGVEMHIVRAKKINVSVYGKNLELRTQAKNISDFLKEKNIILSSEDKISTDQSTAITENIFFKIWREGKQTISAEEPVDFEVEEIKDANRFIGFREVTLTGSKGLRNVTYEVEIINGEVVSKNEISSLIINKPVKQIVVVGIKYNGPDFKPTENKKLWLNEAQISELDWGYVDYIITKESNWNPQSINGTSGACGLAQALPCSKVPGTPLDPVDNLKWADDYANRRYGSWEKAYNFWLIHKWW